jgi:methionyl-tRNA formyltransferase
VKVTAIDLGLPVDQPDSVNTDPFVGKLRRLTPDLIVVVAFGQIFRRPLLDLPPEGAVNLHASILPKYRGVAPINWAIVNGETETGVTTMFMAEKVDAGEIILVRKTAIGPDETAGELSDRLAGMGADALAETVDLIARGKAPRLPQDQSQASYAPKLSRKDGAIEWGREAGTVFNHIRGMSPWPGAYTWFGGKMLHVLRARRSAESNRAGRAGEILTIDEDRGIEVATAEGSVWLLELKPEGRRAMSAAAFARGYRPELGTRPFVASE